MKFPGLRLAVAGMGRSGIAIASAGVKRGANVTVYDQQPADTPEQIATVEKLQGIGASVVTGWHGRLDPADFDILVASPGFARNHPAIRDALAGGREVISEVEFAYRIAEHPIVAITGTNGKSTTTVLTWLLLQGAGYDAVLCGNISGSGYPELTLTEAADRRVGVPPTSTARGRRDADPTVLVAEVSSYQLEWIKEFHPRVAAITNVTPDHLDRHPHFDDYLSTKLRIFENMGEGDMVVMNESEPSLPPEQLPQSIPKGVGIWTFTTDAGMYGLDRGQFTHQETRRQGDEIVLSGKRIKLSDLPLYGDHNVTNALMAWELAMAFSQAVRGAERGPDDNMTEGMLKVLATFGGLQHRMEVLGAKNGVLLVNNSMCTNPAAVIASSSSLPSHQILLMGGLTKGLNFQPVGAYARAKGHQIALFGENDHLSEQLGGNWPKYGSLKEAFMSSVSRASSGWAVLLAPGCASTSPYANFRERGDAFRRMAKEWLNET